MNIEKDVQLGQLCVIHANIIKNETKVRIVIDEGSLIVSHNLILPKIFITNIDKIRVRSLFL